MASDKDKVGIRLQKELDAMKARAKDKGATPEEIKQLERDFFVKRKTKKKPFVSIAKQKEFNLRLKELEKLGRELGISSLKPKMMRGGAVAKKKMRGGGMAKMAKKKMRGGGVMPKRMRGGGMAKMAKKKMMRGGIAKKK